MPEAAHHEMLITKLPSGNRFANLVECLGCKWQSHLLPEENPEAVVKQHQTRYGYKAAKNKVAIPGPEVAKAKPPVPATNIPPANSSIVVIGKTAQQIPGQPGVMTANVPPKPGAPPVKIPDGVISTPDKLTMGKPIPVSPLTPKVGTDPENTEKEQK